jgi:hypothetical protein
MSDNRYRERFVRWQSVTITQLGYTVNLILGLATGSLGFALTLLKDKDFVPQNCQKVFFDLSLASLLLSIALGIWCVISRLRDFRKTKNIARDGEQWKRDGIADDEIKSRLEQRRAEVKSLGKCTWRLFYWQLGSFGFGLVMLFLVFLSIYRSKLF